MLKTHLSYSRIFFLATFFGWQSMSAQDLVEVDLGAVEGEIKKFERAIQWENKTEESVQLSFRFNSQEIQLSEKQITVTSGASVNIPVTLLIPERDGDHEYELRLMNQDNDLLTGYVFSFKKLTAESDVFEAYRNFYWPFRAKENVFNLRQGFIGDTLEASFDILNFSGSELVLNEIELDPNYQISFEPSNIQHNSFARMTVKLSAENLESGFLKERIDIKKDGKLIGSLPIQYTLVDKPDSTSLDAPKLSISRLSHDFKVIQVGDIVKTEFTLRNRGGAALDLSKLESNCDCLTYELPKEELQIGEEIAMTVTFNATGRIGLERKTLAIFSNDPQKPTQVITIRAHVK